MIIRSNITGHDLAAWVVVGVLAGLSHLPADVLYSGGAGMQTWPVPLLWPWQSAGWAVPVVPWGDVGTTLIFVAAMFALYRWPARAPLVAALTLLTVTAYIAVRWRTS